MYRIRKLRKEKKKSMAEVARELQMPYTTYVNYEKEQREPNSEILILLSDYFECSVDYVMIDMEQPYPIITSNISKISFLSPKRKKSPCSVPSPVVNRYWQRRTLRIM